ncbi:centrosomal protein of 19 kDa [Stigmatopora nigra]
MDFEAIRCGLCFRPPSIVLIYKDTETNKLRKRVIPVRNFSASTSDYKMAAANLKNNHRHKNYLQGVSQSQLERLHLILQYHLQGYSLEDILTSLPLDNDDDFNEDFHEDFNVDLSEDPNEDLNKLDDKNLALKKNQMDELFEKNRKHREDPDFVYDLEVDFPKGTDEKCSWDEESEDGF